MMIILFLIVAVLLLLRLYYDRVPAQKPIGKGFSTDDRDHTAASLVRKVREQCREIFTSPAQTIDNVLIQSSFLNKTFPDMSETALSFGRGMTGFFNKTSDHNWTENEDIFIAPLRRYINLASTRDHAAQCAVEETHRCALEWTTQKDVELFEGISELVHKASVRALLGDDFYQLSDELRRLLHTIDSESANPWHPALCLFHWDNKARRARLARERLQCIFTEKLMRRDAAAVAGGPLQTDLPDYVTHLLNDESTASLKHYFPSHNADIMLAAQSSVTATISWVIVQLLRNPDMMNAVKRDARSGQSDSTLLQACIKETRRYFTNFQSCQGNIQGIRSMVSSMPELQCRFQKYPPSDSWMPGRWLNAENKLVDVGGRNTDFFANESKIHWEKMEMAVTTNALMTLFRCYDISWTSLEQPQKINADSLRLQHFGLVCPESCAFCRARKIKCSNGTICDACRKQNVDCVYDWDSRPSKSRTNSQDVSRRNSTADGNIAIPIMQRQRSSTGGSSRSTPFPEEYAFTDGHAPVAMMDLKDVATELNEIFQKTLGEVSKPRSRSSVQDRVEGTSSRPGHHGLMHTSILHLVTHDLVGLVADRFGSLGSTYMEQRSDSFFSSGLASENTTTMFDTVPAETSPLTEYGTRQIGQLVDVWYSIHPLSFLVSKTLLLRELRDGTHDEILLAVILADASSYLGDDASVARARVLMAWAASQLCHRPSPNATSQPGMPGDGISLPGISTAQILMLLGWNALSQREIRRATCYISLCSRISTEIKDFVETSDAPLATSRINGIDVCEVEKEIAAYLYWTTYSLTLWTSLQTGVCFSQSLPASPTSIFLPTDETTSALMRLDEVSDNFSTLQKQKRMIKDMWPLAHIASITAYIVALHPFDSDSKESSTSLWETSTLSLQGGCPADSGGARHELYQVLMESIHVLNHNFAPVPSRSLVLAVYHAMAIHLTFPPPIADASPFPELMIMTDETLERFMASAQNLIAIMLQVGEQNTPTQHQNPVPDVFCFSLDTCARGLSFIYSLKQAGQSVSHHEGQLEALASRLVDIAASDFTPAGSQIRIIKKHLKAVMRAFGGTTSISGSGNRLLSLSPMPPRPRSSASSTTHSISRRNSFLSHSPPAEYLSGAPTAVNSARSSFISPMPTPMLPSLSSSSDDTHTMPFPAYSSPDERAHEWNSSSTMFSSTMDPAPAVFGAPAADLALADMMNFNNTAPGGWFTDNRQMFVDLDMGDSNIGGANLGPHWEWPTSSSDMRSEAAVGGDVDDMFYYFKR
ncbi:hypothetical protein CkaCkLH20_01986 [Colletotrichum karsti]|uniref:Zn(2)-C6 fungal-type domain-containing protein n=1 Tax=Colletotrichum karsti TaxID=1095194 RepID=A0A9P6IEG7_9PEZI|nr:uncharacterized protein CkaCkLH20_01986 [Colletotrichum karsti]KAF9880944.1 hypothetical protein CkaCkLH20_01986 [Colletotrichum karsti]